MSDLPAGLARRQPSAFGLSKGLTRLVPGVVRPLAKSWYRRLNGSRSRTGVERRMRRQAARRPPITYNEKIRYKIAFDRRPILTRLADKVAVREYVAEGIGDEYLTTLHGVATDPREIEWEALPTECVCEVNHASGGMVAAWEGADPEAEPTDRVVGWDRFLIQPTRLDQGRLVALLDHWLSRDYSWFPGKAMIEWAYQDVPHAVLVEELLVQHGDLPRDLKFTVVDGKVTWTQVNSRRFGDHTEDIMSVGWERLPVRYGTVPGSSAPPARPARLDRLVEAAEALGDGLDFVRADFYEVNGRIVFGEMTNYPACGWDRIDPPSFDLEWGRGWSCDYGPYGRQATRPSALARRRVRFATVAALTVRPPICR